MKNVCVSVINPLRTQCCTTMRIEDSFRWIFIKIPLDPTPIVLYSFLPHPLG